MWTWEKDTNKEECSRCDGTGEIEVTDYDEDGNETWHGTETCPDCGGTGKA